jgi:hypothetical protein
MLFFTSLLLEISDALSMEKSRWLEMTTPTKGEFDDADRTEKYQLKCA